MISWSANVLIIFLLWTNKFASSTGEGAQHEILFKNISEILDHLLKDYDNSQHPNYRDAGCWYRNTMPFVMEAFSKYYYLLLRLLSKDPEAFLIQIFALRAASYGRPTMIRTNILIRSMGPVSELDMDYSMDCYFRQYWRDSRLSFRGPVENLSLNIKMLERLWKPDTYFHNGKNSYVHTITLPNKLLRINQEGDILYSMRLTIKAKCPMCLKNFPMDTQSCPLIIGSYAYTSRDILYTWDNIRNDSVSFVEGTTLSQFHLISSPYTNGSIKRAEGMYSVLQVNFNMERHAGYFLIQVYIPCVLIVVLSWVSFWINREATSDRIGLGITAVLTLSTISLDSRTDLPKVHYATALDWFLLMSFGYCMATLLEFAGVHYFTKIGSGEVFLGDEDEWEEFDVQWTTTDQPFEIENAQFDTTADGYYIDKSFGWEDEMEVCRRTCMKSMECKETQTERKMPCFRQFLKCVVADDKLRKERQRAALLEGSMNSVSKIDTISRVLFPVSFFMLQVGYWIIYTTMANECPRRTQWPQK